MLLNLPPQNLRCVSNNLKIHISFLIMLFDKSGFIKYHRYRRIMATIIQKNWKIYCNKKIQDQLKSQVRIRVYSGMGGLGFSN